MPARLLLEIAIRVLGLWFFFKAIIDLANTAYYFVEPTSLFLPQEMITTAWVPIAVQAALGVILTWWGPWISARFYSGRTGDLQLHLNIGPGDVYRVACFVLGVYLLVHSAAPAAQLVISLLERERWSWQLRRGADDAVRAIVYFGSGILLIFGSRRIGTLISNLRYDPNTIPRQQMSLAFLLVLLVLIALALGLIRWLTVGNV